jgi:hypothetical protein
VRPLRDVLPCIADVFIASFGTTPIYAIYLAIGHPADRFLIPAVVWMWVVSLACGEVLVLPVSVFFPSARQPRPLTATVWGIAIACMSSVTLLGLGPYRPWVWLGVVGGAGGLSGVTYAALARSRSDDLG